MTWTWHAVLATACLVRRVCEGRRERGPQCRVPRAPAAQMLADSEPKAACIQGLSKEFTPFVTNSSQVFVEDDSLIAWEEVVDSPSYPSLATQYKMHQLTVRERAACEASKASERESAPRAAPMLFAARVNSFFAPRAPRR
eukprot:6315435-Prymnesium_polylepis.1